MGSFARWLLNSKAAAPTLMVTRGPGDNGEMENAGIARILGEIADLMEIKGDNPFKVRALRNAAQTVESVAQDLCAIAVREPSRLREMPGIGERIAAKIVEIARTGDCEEHRVLLEEYPPSLLELLEIDGVGPKKAKLFFDLLGIRSIEDLEREARSGRLADVPKVREKSVEKILKGIEDHRSRAGRFLLQEAEHVAARVVAWLRAGVPGIDRIEPAGSLRRRKETIGDLDILVTCATPEPVMARFVDYPDVLSVVGRGETKTSVRLRSGLQVDVRVVPADTFGAALHYFTGSKTHNIAIRGRALDRGLTISEYGVFDVKTEKRLCGATEEEVFAAVGLPFVPPELRENRGEVEAGAGGRLPRLVELADLQGDVHMHTEASDGHETIEAMAEAALARGRRYIAITDHSKARPRPKGGHGLDEERLRAHARAIREADRAYRKKGLRLLAGIEVDILVDGTLDLAADALEELDIVIASAHYKFDLDRDEQTARFVRAIESGAVDVIGHPTGRLLLQRSSYPLDVERVVEAARKHGVALEINAYPNRLDLSDANARLAKEAGVPIVISTDSHHPSHLDLLRFGVDVARRAWLEKDDVLNTRPVDEFLEALHGKRRRAASRA